MIWKKKIIYTFLTVSFVLLMFTAVQADLSGQNGYGTNSATMDTVSGKGYSGGMDLVYAQIATGTDAAKTRSFLKCEDGLFGNADRTIKVNMYGYRGDYLNNFAEIVDPFGAGGAYAAYCGAMKVDPVPEASGDRKLWFSMTGNGAADGVWYTVTVDADFIAATGTATLEFSQPACWEVEWDSVSGLGFYAGKENDAWNDPHAVFIRQGGAWVKIVDIGGYSCGFAFAPDGTLCVGSYTDSGPTVQQYVYVFTSAQVQAAINGGAVLTPGDATNTIAIYNPNGVFLGVNDLESDPDGNMYLSANGSWDETYQSDVGYVFKINTPLSAPALTATDIIAQGTMSDDPDYQKALAYDGDTNLGAGGNYDPTVEAGGNRLHVDQDFSWGSGGPDKVCGVALDVDSDTDGVPDSLDNAYLTADAGQFDTDLDMYGNICDGDFNNNGIANSQDRAVFFQSYGKSNGDPDYNPDCDMAYNGTVSSQDRAKFMGRMGDASPYY